MKKTNIEYVLDKINDAIFSFEETGLSDYYKEEQKKLVDIKINLLNDSDDK